MDYAVSAKTEDDEWAADIDDLIRHRGATKSDFGPHHCAECRGPAVMVAVGVNPKTENGHFSPSPHFRITHEDHCVISGHEHLYQKGVLQAAKTHMDPAASYPARWVRPNERTVISPDPDTPPNPRPSTTSTTPRPHRPARRGMRASEVSTLRPIAQHFVAYQGIGFGTRTVEFPGRTADEPATILAYKSAFYRIPTANSLATTPNLIVYAPMMWRAPLDANDNYLAVPLFAGEIPEGANRPTTPYRLRIDWADWTPGRRQHLHTKVKELQREARQFSTSTDTPAADVLAFAYAQRELIDGTDITVTDTADFCFIAAARPPKATHASRQQRRRPQRSRSRSRT